MAIVIMGTFRLANGEGIKSAKLLADHALRVQQEPGCEDYSFAFDVSDPDSVRVAERWVSAEALTTHVGSEGQKVFSRALRVHSPHATHLEGWDGTFWRTLVG